MEKFLKDAMDYYKADIVDENDPHIQKYQEQLYTCYVLKADMIDFDCWTHYIEILDDPTIDFEEYVELDKQFDGIIEDVTAEDAETIARLKDSLSNMRKAQEDLVVLKPREEIDNQNESLEIDDEYEI
ncbi:hypothetical protein EROP_01890 [Erysipelotrichaceae bacterium OPF54]|nr:hypothetical protein EROP_01890 [Erysipelotrichaceae bacterium OPF54]